MVLVSPTGARYPVVPCTFTSGNPHASDEITGTPDAIASSAASQKLSCAEGRRKRSAEARISSTFFIFHRNCTLSCIPSSLESISNAGRSGPSPTMSSVLCTCWCTI